MISGYWGKKMKKTGDVYIKNTNNQQGYWNGIWH